MKIQISYTDVRNHALEVAETRTSVLKLKEKLEQFYSETKDDITVRRNVVREMIDDLDRMYQCESEKVQFLEDTSSSFQALSDHNQDFFREYNRRLRELSEN